MGVWKPTGSRQSGYLWSLSDALAIAEAQHGKLLTPVSSGVMSIFSEYSGQHKGATHEAYSFLVSTDDVLNRWLPARLAFRKQFLPDGRRLSFKNLSERVRWRVLLPFLELVGNLEGNLFTVLIDRRIKRFMGIGGAEALEIFPDCFGERDSETTIEKMIRVESLISLVVAGLRQERQESNWISDHDEALETYNRREQLGRLSAYFTFGLTGWKNPATQNFATTESEYALDWHEDLASVPDLVAGAYCKLAAFLPTRFPQSIHLFRVSDHLDQLDRRASVIGNWLSQGDRPLKHVLLRLELDSQGNAHATAQSFAGQVLSP